MDIQVTGRKMSVSDSLRSYAEEKISNSMKVFDIDPLVAEVVLSAEKNPAIARRCVCEVTMTARGHIIHVEEREDEMHAAIDIAAAKVLRQLRKYKTRVVDRRGAAKTETIRDEGAGGELDLDALMDELAGNEVVRVKEVDFAPMTEEEALVQIELLDHDFFGYVDRDSGLFCILYRRTNGGYGMLRQKVLGEQEG